MSQATGICHIPAVGESARVWWFGFDCAHAFDLVPGMRALLAESGGGLSHSMDETYRTLNYVRDNCEKLAQQLRKWAKKHAGAAQNGIPEAD